MKIVTYRDRHEVRPGVVEGDAVVDLSSAFASVLDLVQSGPEGVARARTAVEHADRRPVAEVELAAPLPNPRRDLWAVGWNYLEHFDEGAGRRDGSDELPEYPAFFVKASTTVIGPNGVIAYDPDLSTQVDYEAELAVVIGRGGRSIPEELALGHVFGYAVANDVTARDIQRRHGGQWIRGKSIDGTCPLGPWIVTVDEVPDPQDLQVTCRVNGEIVQDASTADMAFPVARLISELSLGITLLPGDVLLTGTPSGVGYARDPQLWLRPGDEVTTEVSGVGRLDNRVATTPLAAYEAM